MEEDLKSFLHFRALNGIASSTLYKEKRILIQFFDSIVDYSREEVRRYFASLQVAPATVESRVTAVRNFFNYLQSTERIRINPALFLKSPKVPQKVPQVISRDDVAKLLETPLEGFYDLRAKAILELLYGTGIRQGEIGRLTLSDIDFDAQALLIYGKGNKERLIPLTDRVTASLIEYIKRGRTQVISEPNQWLWLNKFGDKLCSYKFTRIVNIYAKKAGLKNVSCHTLRRSFATHLLQKGVNPYHIAKILGHSDLKTIDHYLAVNVDDLRSLEL